MNVQHNHEDLSGRDVDVLVYHSLLLLQAPWLEVCSDERLGGCLY
jgi:hypothetical protein